jgi:hypothetical protein
MEQVQNINDNNKCVDYRDNIDDIVLDIHNKYVGTIVDKNLNYIYTQEELKFIAELKSKEERISHMVDAHITMIKSHSESFEKYCMDRDIGLKVVNMVDTVSVLEPLRKTSDQVYFRVTYIQIEK